MFYFYLRLFDMRVLCFYCICVRAHKMASSAERLLNGQDYEQN